MSKNLETISKAKTEKKLEIKNSKIKINETVK